MTDSADLASGKGHTDENFPVASALIAARHRPVVLAFYRVARMADDIADNARAPAAEKLARLDAIESSLVGRDDRQPAAAALRRVLIERGLSDQFVRDLLTAFRRDVTQSRYADWDELMDYCRYSAAPVGRFMLAVHGEAPSTWPASDALCAALQVINHLQDCAEDLRAMDRVYIPADSLAAAGLTVEALRAPVASPALRGVIAALARRCLDLLAQSRGLAGRTRDLRLALEIGVIQRLAEDLCGRLIARDPLSQDVHHSKPQAAAFALLGVGRVLAGRLRPSQRATAAP